MKKLLFLSTISLISVHGAFAQQTIHKENFTYPANVVREITGELFVIGEQTQRSTGQANNDDAIKVVAPVTGERGFVKPILSVRAAGPGVSPSKDFGSSDPARPIAQDCGDQAGNGECRQPIPGAGLPAPRLTASAQGENEVVGPKITVSDDYSAHCEVPALYFEKGSARVRPEGFASVLRALQACGPIQILAVSVSGYTCDLGGQELNDHLAASRAQNVALMLQAQGYKIKNVSAHGREGYVTQNPDLREKNRRVEIEGVLK